MILKALFLVLPLFMTSQSEALESKSIQEILANARQKNQELNTSSWDAKIVELEKLRVKAQFNPKLQARFGAGPTSGVTGNALVSENDPDDYGLAWIGNVELTWPLWTWGRKDNYLEAVRAGALVKESQKDEKWLEVRYRVRESYYGYLLAKTLGDFIAESLQKVEEAVSSLGRKQKDKKYKLEILLAQAKQKQAEAETGLELAKIGLKVFGGYPEGVLPADEWLVPGDYELKELSYYLKRNKEHPKFKMIEKGLVAKKALEDAEFKGRFPVLGLLAQYRYAHSDKREDQQSSFAYDPFNHSEAVVGVGFQWSIQWGEQSSKIQKIRAEKSQLQAQQAWAEQGLGGLVEKAWYEFKKAEQQLQLAKKAQKAGKKWLSRKAIGSGTGLTKSEALIEAFLARAQTRKEYLEAVYAYELAWATLEKAVGSNISL